MKKRLSTIILVMAILCFSVLAVASGSDEPKKETGGNGGSSSSTSKKAKDEKYSVGETAAFKNIKVTADEIIINAGSEYLEPEEGKKFVAVKFTIENISDEDQSMSSILLFDGYADDVKCDYSFSANMGLEGTLDGDVSPGKKLIGYYGVEVSKDAKVLDLEVKASWLDSGKAVFSFDIPQ